MSNHYVTTSFQIRVRTVEGTPKVSLTRIKKKKCSLISPLLCFQNFVATDEYSRYSISDKFSPRRSSNAYKTIEKLKKKNDNSIRFDHIPYETNS